MGQPPDNALSAQERALLDRCVADAEAALGVELHAVWLFGSRARGERDRAEDSDVDLLAIAADASWKAKERIRGVLSAAARELGLEATAWSFSVHVRTPQWLTQRREIRSFFIAEVDRDKVVLSGHACARAPMSSWSPLGGASRRRRSSSRRTPRRR